ncbi:ATP-dependent helicase [Rothia sp. HMSC065C12]|uniref:ATP-dependent DNA helicase n=1 Tax=unclassified Rothia (in: high G+C Gram-positive bacteria) TaxID=2689056 RepID=UPI0008A2397D|nr:MULTISPECIES: ATP-dependent DNA helicase [unclassified Rothia (in: high G+C Gram-positive bacteria)]OFJ97467.1 ATP-dependent helicase [Rothia sp. HMSC065C12]OFR45962.1 ATP-dependent helicase [Rothia sp. HMSC073B08]
MSVTESINAPKNAPGTAPEPATDGTRFTGQELETLPGAKDALTLLDEAVAATGGQNRAGQRTMAAHVAQALELQRHLLVQAGTGTGKSLGYLVPALARVGESDQPIVVATATLALQAQIVNRDIPRLLQALEPRPESQAQVALLKGRNNYLCLHKLEGGYPEDEPDALFDMPSSTSRVGEEVVRLREWADRTETGDRDELKPGVSDRAWAQVSVSAAECLGRRCPLVEECFSEMARSRAAEADIVITNHALLAINAFEGMKVLPEHETVIIDEAHELVDRVTGAVSGSLTVAMVRRAARSVKKHSKADSGALEMAAGTLETAFEGLAEGLLKGLDGRLLTAISAVNDAARTALSDTKPDGQDVDAGLQMARSRVSEVHDMSSRILEASGEQDVLWISRQGGWENGRYVAASDTDPATLNIAPLSVGLQLRDGLFADRTVILTSATLTVGDSFDVAAGALGLQGEGAPRWTSIDVGSPFDYRKQGIMYVAGDLKPPGFGVHEGQLERLRELCEASEGGALGLFSSKRAAERAAEYMREHSDLNILLQGESSLKALVEEFSEDVDSCLFGTMSLWQGVDVPGDSCRLVVMDRIPFPRPDDPIAQARTEAVNRHRGNGFMAVSAHHAAIRMAQGAGRLIRSVSDRGVVAVLDSRVATKRYGGFLMKAMPPMWSTQNKAAVIGALARLSASIER